MVDIGEPLVSSLQIPIHRVIVPIANVILALELHICPSHGDCVGRLCNFSPTGAVWKEKRIGNEKWEVVENCTHLPGSHLQRKGSTMQRSRYMARLRFLVLCATQPTLHAQCTLAILSATAMRLLHCCSNKGKRSSGVVGACAIKRHTQTSSKAAIQQAPLEEALVSLRHSGAYVFSIRYHFLISPRRLILWKETTSEIVFYWKTFGGSWSLGSLFRSFRNLR